MPRLAILWSLLLACSSLACSSPDADRIDGEEIQMDLADIAPDLDVRELAVDGTPNPDLDVRNDASLDVSMDAGDTDSIDDVDVSDDMAIPTRTDLLLFTEVAASAGLSRPQWDLPRRYQDVVCGQAALFTGGAAVMDIDGDGFDDIFLPRQAAPHQMLMNQTDGTFRDRASAMGLDEVAPGNGAAWVDVDNDGDLDLFVSYSEHQWLHLFVQQNDGTFVDESSARLPDFTANVDECEAYSSISAGDYDRDGDLDVHISHWANVDPGEPQQSRLLQNDGAGVFADVTVAAEVDTWGAQDYTSAFADADADGWPDLLIVSDFGDSQLYRNQGNGLFKAHTALSNVGHDQNGMGSAVGDLDNDGDLDWFVTAIFDVPDPNCPSGWGCSGNRLYVNDGTGVFSDETDVYGVRRGGWGWAPVMFDADLDGDLDLAMTNGHDLWWDYPAYRSAVLDFVEDPTRLWINNGSGQFMLERSRTSGIDHKKSGKGMVAFDMDNDGDLELLIVNNGDVPSLYRNDSPPGYWLRVRLDGITNRFGVGAEVWVTPNQGDTPIRRDVTVNASYLATGPIEAHFGFADDPGVLHEVRVVWPDTRSSQLLSDVTANQLLTIQQAP